MPRQEVRSKPVDAAVAQEVLHVRLVEVPEGRAAYPDLGELRLQPAQARDEEVAKVLPRAAPAGLDVGLVEELPADDPLAPAIAVAPSLRVVPHDARKHLGVLVVVRRVQRVVAPVARMLYGAAEAVEALHPQREVDVQEMVRGLEDVVLRIARVKVHQRKYAVRVNDDLPVA